MRIARDWYIYPLVIALFFAALLAPMTVAFVLVHKIGLPVFFGVALMLGGYAWEVWFFLVRPAFRYSPPQIFNDGRRINPEKLFREKYRQETGRNFEDKP